MSASAQLQVTLAAALVSAITGTSGGAVSAQAPLSATLAQLVNGTGSGQCDRVCFKQVTIAASANTDIDVYSMTDVGGNAVNLARAKIVILQSQATVDGDDITVGNKAATSGWTNLLAGTTQSGATYLKAGGCLIFVAPLATAFPIASDGTNHLIHLLSTAANSVVVNCWVIGASV